MRRRVSEQPVDQGRPDAGVCWTRVARPAVRIAELAVVRVATLVTCVMVVVKR
jgi:hypothetical protein